MNSKFQIGQVFYRIKPCDYKIFHKTCRVCGGERKLTINGVTFNCPVCQKEEEAVRTNAFKVVRYKVCSVTEQVFSRDWSIKGCDIAVMYGLFTKHGKGYGFANDIERLERSEANIVHHLNVIDENRFDCETAIFDDYKLAVQAADEATKRQIERLKKYNEDNGTDYEIPVFEVEHDRKQSNEFLERLR